MPEISRRFLGWKKPLLEILAEELWPQREQFEKTLFIVPTSESGRKLREKLTEKGAYLSPQCITPAQFVSQTLPPVSSLLERSLWEEILLNTDPRDWPALLPQTQPKHWQRGVSRQIIEARHELQQSQLNFKRVAEGFDQNHADYQRYQFLAFLEKSYRKRLVSLEIPEPVDLLESGEYQFPFAQRRILLLGVSDPSELFQKLALHAAEHYEVEAWIHGEEDFAEGFTTLGIPSAEYWANQQNELIHNDQIHRPNDFSAMARQVAESIGSTSGQNAIGGVTKTMLPFLELELKTKELILHNPEGQKLADWPFLKWLKIFCDWVETKELTHLSSLLQSDWTGKLLRPELEMNNFEQLSHLYLVIDRFIVRTEVDLWSVAKRKEELGLRPNELYALSSCLDLVKALNGVVAQLRKAKQSFAELGAFLAKCLKAQESDEIQALTEVFHTVKEEVENFPAGVSLQQDYVELFIESCARAAVVEPKVNTDLDASGWLELGYETAPALHICGMNEGVIPKGEGYNPWLSRPLKEELGLKGDKERFGHDAYFLRALCESRSEDGALNIYVPGYGEDGSPLQPSRLLLKTQNNAERALHVFSDKRFALSTPAWARDWQYKVNFENEPLEKISITQFTDYLSCPFRFYLKHVLKMQRPDRKKTEWNARDYGTLIHQVLENMSRDEQAATFTAKGALTDWLITELDRILVVNEEREISLVTQIQRDSMQQRLSFFAEKEAFARLNEHQGYRTITTEAPFQLNLNEVLVKGTIDRVDESPEGILRLIDYKTGRPKKPEKAHLTKITKSTKIPKHLQDSAAIIDYEGKPHLWTNLQLPMYAFSYYAQNNQVPETAYCNVAQTLADTSYKEWIFTKELIDGAVKCAEFIIGQIQSKEFSTIVEKSSSSYDDYKEFSFGYPLENAFHLADS